MKLLGAPSRWRVTLTDGSVVRVYAVAVEGLSGSEDERDYVFHNLLDVDLELQPEFEVTGSVPGHPERVMVVVARFPRASVATIVTDG